MNRSVPFGLKPCTGVYDAARGVRDFVKKQKRDGIVISQSPAGGATANKGSAVTIVVGKFTPPTNTTTTPTTTTPTTPTTPTTGG